MKIINKLNNKINISLLSKFLNDTKFYIKLEHAGKAVNIFCLKIINKQIINFYNHLVFNDQLSFRKIELVHVPFERTNEVPSHSVNFYGILFIMF